MYEVNERVKIVCLFRHRGNPAALIRPVKMRWGRREITFKELGLRHPTSKGRRMVHVFDMSDGVDDYRLEFDAEMLTWTLAAVLPGGQNG